MEVKVLGVTLLTIEQCEKYRDNFKLFDWFWLKDCRDEKVQVIGFKDDPAVKNDDYELFCSDTLEPGLYTVTLCPLLNDHDGKIHFVWDRSDVCFRPTAELEDKKIQIGTKLKYNDAPWTVIGEGLALCDYVMMAPFWHSTDDLTFTWESSNLKALCEGYYSSGGDVAYIAKEE